MGPGIWRASFDWSVEMKIEVERRTNTKELVLEDDFEADRIRPLYRDYFEVWGEESDSHGKEV